MTLRIALHRVPAWAINGAVVTLGLTLLQCSITLVAGSAAAQLAVASGVCASFADAVTTTRRVSRRVLAAMLSSTAAATLFLSVRPFAHLRIPAVVLIVFAAMLLLSWGPKASPVAFATVLSLVFAMSVPDSTHLTWSRFGWGLAGSAGYWVWAVTTAHILQPTWRRLALAAVAQSMSRLYAAISRESTSQASATWEEDIVAEGSVLAERFQSARDLVFSQHQDTRARRETAVLLQLVDLRDLAMICGTEAVSLLEAGETSPQAELFGGILMAMSREMCVVMDRLETDGKAVANSEPAASVEAMLSELERTADAELQGPVGGISRLLASQLALVRSIQQVLAGAEDVRFTCKRRELSRYVSADNWRFAAVVPNLRPSAPVFRHAARTCATAGAAFAVSRFVPWTLHPQWIVLTIAAVLQGNLADTLQRRNARVLGTLVGCLIVVPLSASGSSVFLSACVLVATGVGHAFFAVRYAVASGASAVMALLLAHLAAPEAGFRTLERFGDTVAGALLGWAATYALPIWERQTLPAAIRQAVDALLTYTTEAMRFHAGAQGMPRLARQHAYDAIRAVAATRKRSLVEPADVRVPIPQLAAWLKVAYALMSQLSSLRLAIAMHTRDCESWIVADGMTTSTRAIVSALRGDSLAAQPAARLSEDVEQALSAVPDLASRVRAAIDTARRLAMQTAEIERQLLTEILP